jgi:hypothetical protein
MFVITDNIMKQPVLCATCLIHGRPVVQEKVKQLRQTEAYSLYEFQSPSTFSRPFFGSNDSCLKKHNYNE